MPSNIKIATAPCSWGVWYADGTPSGTPWNIFLDQASGAGYKSLELGPDGYLPTDAAVLIKELSARNLDVCAGTACYQFDKYRSLKDYKSRIDALLSRIKSFDAKYLVTMDESDVGEYSEKKAGLSKDDWTRFLDMFKELGNYTKNEYGIETVWHPHIKTLIETEDEIIRMMEHCGLNLCFDTGHHAYVNGGTASGAQNTINFIKDHKDRIVYLHFKNVDGKVMKQVEDEHLNSDRAFDIDVMCDLRYGIIDFKELKKILDDINYHGIGVIEMDMPRATTAQAFAAAKRNLQYLEEIKMIS